MINNDHFLKSIIDFSKKDDNIRAALLTSSRANKNAETDFLSDYDIELYVNDIRVIKKNDEWINSLGKVIIRWPLYPRATLGDKWITRLLLFENGFRVDFQITDDKNARLKNIDYGFEILVDKDNILTNLPKPTHSQYNIKKPEREDFELLVNEFWWNATYVPKYLWRDELPFAKMMMGQSVQDKYLRTIIEWYIGFHNNWNVNTGVYGRYFKKYLNLKIWEKYEKTYSTADLEENWTSFFVALDLFGELAKELSQQLGYEYPYQMEESMKTFYKRIRNEKKKSK